MPQTSDSADALSTPASDPAIPKKVLWVIASISTLIATATLAVALGAISAERSTRMPTAALESLKIQVLANRKEALVSHLAQKFNQPKDQVRLYVELAWLEAERHPDVTPELILAVIQKESSLRERIRNSYGAEGLMQVVRRFHSEKLKKHESLLDANVNIRVGAQILQEYLDWENGDLAKALNRYSAKATDYVHFVEKEMETLKQL